MYYTSDIVRELKISLKTATCNAKNENITSKTLAIQLNTFRLTYLLSYRANNKKSITIFGFGNQLIWLKRSTAIVIRLNNDFGI